MAISTPDWVKHAVFYQIFPDSFARTIPPDDNFLRSVPVRPWQAEPSFQGYKGGNLWGVIDRLDYLKDLGINAIYFTPIFQSASNHRYQTHDYYQIDPILGGNKAFKALLTQAHDREIKVVLDGVFNHCSRGFFYFHDVLENGGNSPWLDWFTIEGWPLAPYRGDCAANYRSWAGHRSLPEFNHYHPAAREYIMEVGEYWIRQGIDGWRLDVPGDIKAPGFWQEFRDRIKAINSEAYIVGEIWEDASQWLDGSQFDGVMNYLFTEPTIAFCGGDLVNPVHLQSDNYKPYPGIDAATYRSKIEELLDLYDWEIHQAQLNLLDSHDTARVITMVGGDRATVNLATLLLMTFPGAPSIYYGDEVGLAGSKDPDCRRGFPPENQWDLQVLAYHKELIKLRHSHGALRVGDYRIEIAEGMVYGFSRNLAQESLLVVINGGDRSETIDLPSNQNWQRILFGQGTLEHQGQQVRITIPPRQGVMVGR